MQSQSRTRRWSIRIAIGIAVLVAACVLLIGAFPVGWLRSVAENRISNSLGSKVSVGSVTRSPWFSFTPVISVRDVSIDQPAWAGPGKLLTVRAAEARLSVWSLLNGNVEPRSLRIDGLEANLVRGADKRNNWSDNKPGDGRGGVPRLADLTIANSRFTLRDARRSLTLAGTIDASAAQGLRIASRGRFHGTPATVTAQGGRIAGVDAQAPYPFALAMRSPLLSLDAKGEMAGTLVVNHFSGRLSARGQNLNYLDDIIGAGLFNTQPIALTADVRRDSPDWHIEALRGTVGRSRLSGNAVIRKQDGRSKIDGAIRFSQLDFRDLSSDAGLARAAALKARIGPRIIPRTRINLSKIGKVDGKLRVRADRLLVEGGSVFKSISGTLLLDNRVLTVPDLLAGLSRGQVAGRIRIVQRNGPPLLTIDARITGTTLEQLFGSNQDVSGPVRGRIRLSGRGNTIREALARGTGKVAVVAGPGQIKAVVARILGQDLGRAVAQALGDGDARVPLNCVIADFDARGGVLTPSPFLIETGVSVGRGSGSINLDGETVALRITGASRKKTLLRLADPIRIEGTFSAPKLSVAGIGAAEKPRARTMLKVVGKSLGQLFDGKKTSQAPVPTSLGCKALANAAFR